MPRCFVIQPFDGGAYNARFDDVLSPAIKEAGLDPYRVDRNPGVTIPIDAIENDIRDSEYCLADITPNNPNVWYEVGFAFASGKEVVLICSKERDDFPFDVRHRNIIRYETHSRRNFDKLSKNITERLLALQHKAKAITGISLIKPSQGLSPHEMTALVLLMEARLAPGWGSYPHSIKDDMARVGFNQLATSLALEGLLQKSLVEFVVEHGYNNEAEVFKISESGARWCMENQDKLNLRLPSSPHKPAPAQLPDDEDEDIPF